MLIKGDTRDKSCNKYSVKSFSKGLMDNMAALFKRSCDDVSPDNKTFGKDKNNGNPQKRQLYRYLQVISLVIFIISACLFANETIIQPYRSKKVVEKVQSLYPESSFNSEETIPALTSHSNDDQCSDPALQRDSEGRFIKFHNLLRVNTDVKGWIIVPDSEIDYPVLQSSAEDPEYYLERNIYREYDRQGSLFIDVKSSVEKNSKNIVIYGHNMKTGAMFHDIARYQDLNFYKDRPIIYFDSLYQTGIWKIFAVIITNGSTKNGDTFFDYTRTEFQDESDFLNFVHQLRVRSLYNFNVDINENDQLLTLSTCSYELPDYRTVVVARKVRDGENLDVDVDASKNTPLYPQSWYKTYGGEPPKVLSFEEALEAGMISWYKP